MAIKMFDIFEKKKILMQRGGDTLCSGHGFIFERMDHILSISIDNPPKASIRARIRHFLLAPVSNSYLSDNF